MTAGSFPAAPAERRAIVVLKQHDVEKCSYEPGAARVLLDEEVYVLQFPVRQIGEVPASLQNIIDAGLARPGVVLVQSPFDADSYEDAELAPQRFALAKHMHFSTFCMHLGAKEVSVKQIVLRTRSGTSTADVKTQRLGQSAQVQGRIGELARFRAEMNLRDEFSGGPADVATAEKLLRRTGLWSDSSLRSLLDMRRDAKNQLRTRELALSLSNEAKTNLSVVGRLKVPAFVSLSAAYDRIAREQHDFTLTVVVRF
ncbi:MAG: hypothetical protein ABI548_18210 [Polyangiaceae bacterium]